MNNPNYQLQHALVVRSLKACLVVLFKKQFLLFKV